MNTLQTKDPEVNEKSIYSFGTYPIINRIYNKLILEKKHYDTIIIDLATIIRNNISKDINQNDTIIKIKSEINELIQDIVYIFNNTKNLYSPVILCYIYDYNKVNIPEKYLRNNKSLEYFNIIFNRFLKEVNKIPKDIKINNVRVLTMEYKNSLPIYKMLYNTISGISNKHDILMVTHQYICFHLLDKLRKIKIIESNTGKVVTFDELGIKVFKDENIPFTKLTHVLLGDKHLLKQSLSKKDKKRFLELSISENWKLKTRAYVDDKIKENFNIEYTLK